MYGLGNFFVLLVLLLVLLRVLPPMMSGMVRKQSIHKESIKNLSSHLGNESNNGADTDSKGSGKKVTSCFD